MSKKDYKNKITEDAAKRFRMLCEYTFNITEDDGEQDMENPENDGGGDDMNQQPTEQPMDGGQNNAMPPMGPEQGNGMEQPMNQPMNQPMGPEQGNANGGPQGFDPSERGMDDMNGMDGGFGGDVEPMQSDDEVIDVDDLTDSQEKTEKKVDKVKVTMEKGFEKLLGVVNKLNKMIDDNTANMEQIRQEFERRNPTPLEKLNMRAANDSYPFNVSPNEYWKNKEMNSNYRIGGENEEDAKQYTITQNDIDNITDFNQISKELESDEFNQNLMNIFNLR